MEEALIIKQIQEGIDVDKGFKLLVLQHQEKIYWHIRSLMKSHEDTNDVMQNTFIKAYRNIGSFKSNSKFYTWIYRIATNESLNALNKNNRQRTSALDKHDSYIKNLNAESVFDENHAQEILEQAIDQLPDKQKLVFNMKYFDEMTYNQISEILETSVGALKASFHHASKKIEAYIKSTSYE